MNSRVNPYRSPIAESSNAPLPSHPPSSRFRLPLIVFGTIAGGLTAKVIGTICFGSPFYAIGHVLELLFIPIGGSLGAWMGTYAAKANRQ